MDTWEDKTLNLSGDLGMLYFAVGRDAEGEQCCQQLIRTHPDRAVGYVLLSDELLRRFRKGLAGQGVSAPYTTMPGVKGHWVMFMRIT